MIFKPFISGFVILLASRFITDVFNFDKANKDNNVFISTKFYVIYFMSGSLFGFFKFKSSYDLLIFFGGSFCALLLSLSYMKFKAVFVQYLHKRKMKKLNKSRISQYFPNEN